MIVPPAGAQTRSGEAMADSCWGCHGDHARTRGTIPPLDDWKAPAIAAALRGFRDGPQPGTVMGRIAKGFTDAEIHQLALALAARCAGPGGGRR